MELAYNDELISASGSAFAVLVIAQVCSHWRTIALSFPALWNAIDCEKMTPYQIGLFCDKARNYPLRMLRCDLFDREDLREAVASKLSSIQVLEITPRRRGYPFGRHTNILRTFTEACNEPPLMLKSFSCRHWESALVLEAPLFQGQTPLLRQLCLDGVRMPWNRGFYCNLTVLRITGIPLGKLSPYDEDICLALQDCPHLRELALSSIPKDHDFPRDGDPIATVPYPRKERIHLESLHHLSLHMPPHYGHHVLSGIAAEFVDDVHLTLQGHIQFRYSSIVGALCQPETFPYVVFHRPASLSITAHGYSQIHGYSKETMDTDEIHNLHRCFEWEWCPYSRGTDSFDITHRLIQTGRPYMRKVLQFLTLDLSLRAMSERHDYVPDLLLPCRHLLLKEEPTTKLIVQRNQADDELERMDWSNLERLTIDGDSFTLETVCAVVDWGLRRSSLRTIVFDPYIEIVFPPQHGLDILKSRVEKANSAGIKVQWDPSQCRFTHEIRELL